MLRLPSAISGRRAMPGTRPALVCALLLCLPGGAQVPYTPHAQSFPKPQPGVFDSSADPAIQAKQLIALNRDRQKALVSDADKILRLATELDMQVKTDNPDSLTPFQLRQLVEIEKLAHNVKDKMSFSVYGPSEAPPPRQLPYQ